MPGEFWSVNQLQILKILCKRCFPYRAVTEEEIRNKAQREGFDSGFDSIFFKRGIRNQDSRFIRFMIWRPKILAMRQYGNTTYPRTVERRILLQIFIMIGKTMFLIRAIFHTPKGHKKLLRTDSGEFLPSREIFSSYSYVMSDSHKKWNRFKRVEMVLYDSTY